MSRTCAFTDELSIEAGADGFRVYGGANVDYFRNLQDVDFEADVVQLRSGLVHLFGRQNVYEIRVHPEYGFTVSKIAERYAQR